MVVLLFLNGIYLDAVAITEYDLVTASNWERLLWLEGNFRVLESLHWREGYSIQRFLIFGGDFSYHRSAGGSGRPVLGGRLRTVSILALSRSSRYACSGAITTARTVSSSGIVRRPLVLDQLARVRFLD